MIFNSYSFLGFFLIVFFLYYFVLNNKIKLQNWLLLLASYCFYGCANWKMIPILLISTLIFYMLGLAIHKTAGTPKSSRYKLLGIILGVGVLLYFKYMNFFIESFANLFNIIGLHSNWGTFNILMPLGISFFTFKLISYIIEVYREKMEPEKDFVSFATYIAFFPTIMSGPIDRPNTFIRQLHNNRPFDYDLSFDGIRQILWGLFKKMVIADTIALVVNEIWKYQDTFSASTLIMGAILYVFQMYADFSGYSDMAIGVGKILGFRIAINFNYPLFARDISEYWRNWHISLTSWLTDYVFMPLNVKYRNLERWGSILAIIITYLLIGLWHGANWTFALFGLYHGLLYIPLMLSGTFFKKKKLKITRYKLPYFSDFLKMVGTFLLVTFGLVIFRADNIQQAIKYISNVCSASIMSFPKVIGYNNVNMLLSIIFIIIMLLYEWKNRNKEYGLDIKEKMVIVQYCHYIFIAFLIYFFGIIDTSGFIYFKF